MVLTSVYHKILWFLGCEITKFLLFGPVRSQNSCAHPIAFVIRHGGWRIPIHSLLDALGAPVAIRGLR